MFSLGFKRVSLGYAIKTRAGPTYCVGYAPTDYQTDYQTAGDCEFRREHNSLGNVARTDTEPSFITSASAQCQSE